MYFTSMDVIKVKDGNKSVQIRPFRLNPYALRSWDRWVVDLITKTHGAWCAGGTPLALYTNKLEQINDWDIFVENNIIKNTIEHELIAFGFQQTHAEGYLTEWQKGAENSCKVQVITKNSMNDYNFVDSEFIGKVFEDFDISVCRVGFRDIENFYIATDAIDDIANSIFRLRLISPKTDMRIRKYENKGYVLDENSRMTAKKGKVLY